ncbi:MAG: hypothetical protein L6Q71_04090 [Planctomycetes bacterium]|nr:hypothetical protein [Planctomycetota bacterium]NUQ33812.1 hypothetical protein [Planctomycetaceae bacterium]
MKLTKRLVLMASFGIAAPLYAGDSLLEQRLAGAGGVSETPAEMMARNSLGQEAPIVNPGMYRILFDLGSATNEISGTGAFSGTEIGTEIDFQDTLGLDEESEVRFGVQFTLDWFRLDFAFSDFQFAGDEAIATDINFGDFTFDTSANVVTDFDAQYFRGYIGFTPFTFDVDTDVKAELGFGFSIHAITADVTLTGTEDTTGDDITEQQDAPIPGATIGLHGGIYFGMFAIEPQFGIGIFPEVSGVEADVLDGSLTVRIRPWEWLTIGAKAGIFQMDIEADIDDEFVGDMEVDQTHFAGVFGFEW